MKRLGEIKRNTPDGTYKIHRNTKGLPPGKLRQFKCAIFYSETGTHQSLLLGDGHKIKHCYRRRLRFFKLIPGKWKKVW